MDERRRYRAGMAAYNAGRYADAIEHLMPLASSGAGAQALLGRFYLGQAHYRLAIGLYRYVVVAQYQRRRTGHRFVDWKTDARVEQLRT